jgi:FkbM family methyltransferase
MDFVKFQVQIHPEEPQYIIYDFRGSHTPVFVHEDMRRNKAPDLVGDRLVLDIGANVGMWSFRMAKLYPECHFIAVEPYPINQKHFLMGLKENGLTNVDLMECAVTADGRDVTLIMDPTNSGSASELNNASAMFPSQKVHSRTLNEICEHHASIDAMKVDIEGGEFTLFDGFKHWDKLKKLFIEVHPHCAGITEQEKAYAIKSLVGHLRDKIGANNVFVDCTEEKYRGI